MVIGMDDPQAIVAFPLSDRFKTDLEISGLQPPQIRPEAPARDQPAGPLRMSPETFQLDRKSVV